MAIKSLSTAYIGLLFAGVPNPEQFLQFREKVTSDLPHIKGVTILDDGSPNTVMAVTYDTDAVSEERSLLDGLGPLAMEITQEDFYNTAAGAPVEMGDGIWRVQAVEQVDA